MKDWIEKNIDPPGMEKKNRGSLFSFIGRVFQIVRNDALKAFNAFFPYLADWEKLSEHGDSLSIPELPFDSEDEYRERVSTASFYLMRAGERSYILEQMKEHFGDRFILKEDFLKVFIEIAELAEKDRIWVHSLLDGLLDPNIQLTVAEWFRYVDYMAMSEELSIRVTREDRDSFAGRFLCNGQFYCDQGTEVLCDGAWLCDGSIKCERFIPARGTISDYFLEGVYADGRHICDGSFDCSGYDRIFGPVDFDGPLTLSGGWGEDFSASLLLEPMEEVMQINAICDGRFLCDGSNAASMADGPLTLRIIQQFHCDGVHQPSCSVCDGSIICDGSYQGYDGLYCSGDQIHEEVLL
jgi:hypothetical protein